VVLTSNRFLLTKARELRIPEHCKNRTDSTLDRRRKGGERHRSIWISDQITISVRSNQAHGVHVAFKAQALEGNLISVDVARVGKFWIWRQCRIWRPVRLARSRIRFQNHHIAEPWSDLAEQSFAGRSPKVKTLADHLFHAVVEVISEGTDLRLELDDGNDDSLICHNDIPVLRCPVVPRQGSKVPEWMDACIREHVGKQQCNAIEVSPTGNRSASARIQFSL
jgi:hypothetical protein